MLILNYLMNWRLRSSSSSFLSPSPIPSPRSLSPIHWIEIAFLTVWYVRLKMS